LHEGADSNPDARARFRREARTASLLSHPNICTIFEIDEVDGKTFIAFELLDGDSLDQKIASGLSPREVLEFGIQTADAIDTAHGEGILHRDIKPANIYITRRGQVKVLDFGLAKPVRKGRASSALEPSDLTRLEDVMTTSAGMAVGTIAYMSPEQARGETLDSRSDLFSFGVVLYEMATGQQTFRGSTSAVIFDAILNRDPVSPRQLNPSVSEDLERIILKALEKDREMRYQSAADMRADLQRLKRSNESGRLSVSAIQSSVGTAPSGVGSAAIQAASAAPHPGLASSADVTMLTPAVGSGPGAAPAVTPTTPAGPGGVSPIPSAVPAVTRATAHPAASKSSPSKFSPPALAMAGVAALVLVSGGWFFMRSSTPPVEDAEPLATSAPTETPGNPPTAEVAASTAPAVPTTPGGAVAATAPSTPASATPGGARTTVPAGPSSAAPGAAVAGVKPGASAVGGAAATGKPAAPATAKPATPPATGGADATELRVIADKVDARLYDQAVTDLKALVARAPNDATMLPAYFQLAEVFDRQGKRDDAMSTYSDIASRFPSDARSIEARLKLARAILLTNRRTKDQDARQVLAGIGAGVSGPSLAEAFELKATIEQRLKLREMDPVLQTNAPSAAITLRTLVERVPDAPQVEEALIILARVYEEMRRFEYAASAMVQLATKFPAKHANEMWFEAGEMYERRTPQLQYARDAYANVPKGSRRFEEAQKRIERIEKQLAR
jgi:serine/threonine protein kinase/TolA-binding protein